MSFPDFDQLLQKLLLGQPHDLPCTLGTDGHHQPHTFFWNASPVEVICHPNGELGFIGLDGGQVLKASCQSLDALGLGQISRDIQDALDERPEEVQALNRSYEDVQVRRRPG
jgi:hypothetical protein